MAFMQTFKNGITLPKTEGAGIKVDVATPTYPWRDLIGLIQPDVSNQNSPSRVAFSGDVYGNQYSVGDRLDCVFHIPHDWVPNSDAEIHLHLGFIAEQIVDKTIDFVGTVTYGSRDGAYSTPITLETLTYTSVAGAMDAAHGHPVIEVPLCKATGDGEYDAGYMFDSSLIEVDGLIVVSFVTGTVNTTGAPFIFTADIHYQSTGVGTKNNADPFYG